MRRATTLLLGLGLMSSCGKTITQQVDPIFDGGPEKPPVVEPDAGPIGPLGPALAPGFGPFTGTYDVNGGGLLLAVQVDGYLGLQVNDKDHQYLGVSDGGTLGGSPVGLFRARTTNGTLEDCGPVTLTGTYYNTVGQYKSVSTVCTLGTSTDGPLQGARYIGGEYYRQDLSVSGVYDLVETPTSFNTCTGTGAPPYRLKLGVSVGEGDRPSLLLAAGDTVLDQLLTGDVADGGLVGSATDPVGRLVGSISLHAQPDGTFAGTRHFKGGTDAAPCVADLTLAGSRRAAPDGGAPDAGHPDAGHPDGG
jgi:hypothetical protein